MEGSVDAEVPVGMACPLDLEIVTVVEGELDVFAVKLIGDGAVVDAVDRDFAAIVLIEEAIVLFADFGDVDRGNVEPVLVDVEVRQSLLLGGIDLKRTAALWVVVADDDFLEKSPVGFLVEAAEIAIEIGIEFEGFDVLVREDVLIAAMEGKAWSSTRVLKSVLLAADEAEVDGHGRMGVNVVDVVFGGDGLIGASRW